MPTMKVINERAVCEHYLNISVLMHLQHSHIFSMLYNLNFQCISTYPDIQ